MKRKAVWISCILTALFCGRSADARVIITLDQVGPNVVATGSGRINTTGLTLLGGQSLNAFIDPSGANLFLGSAGESVTLLYTGVSGPVNFGTGDFTSATTATPSPFAFFGIRGSFGDINVPTASFSGSFLSGTATWDNTTIAALGARVGAYTWTWGSGANADSLTLFVTPEPGTLGLLGTSVISLAGMVRRKLKLRT
jgi:hypothetical protein